jgi:uncharacterized protein (DUF433 family)
MENAYVEHRDGGYWIKGSRVSLDSIVYEFKEGAAPGSIRRAFPTLNLEQVYGAITFYLSKQAEIDAYLAESEEVTTVLNQLGFRRNQICQPE